MKPLVSSKAADEYQVDEISKLTQLLTAVISRVADGWDKGEADIIVEIRQERKDGEKKAKVRGGAVERI